MNGFIFFRKAHLYATAIGEKQVSTAAHGWPELAMTEAQVKQQASLQNLAGFEGIWTTGNYKLGVVKYKDGFKGIVLETTSTVWKTNQVKFEIAKDGSGIYFMGDRSAVNFPRATLTGNKTLQLGTIFLNRLYPALQDDDTMALYVKTMQAAMPFIQQLSSTALLFRIPSFDDRQKPFIDSLLLANKTLIEKTPQLIIDIRNNGGGSDISYEKLLPYLYTNPISTIGMEFLSTPLNNTRMENYLKIPGLSAQDKKEINEALQLLRDNMGKFVNFSGQAVSTLKLDSVLLNPANIAIIINENNGSTAEQFLLAAKQSKKVKLFGTTTMGVLDISNMHFVESPSGDIRLGYCLSRSLRLPAMPIDDIGIQPDYFIQADLPPQKWLGYVQTILGN